MYNYIFYSLKIINNFSPSRLHMLSIQIAIIPSRKNHLRNIQNHVVYFVRVLRDSIEP